ncbi:GNAT family N-acetyltransferase [Halobacillus salinarum]|uniref:GNAT family N-acetyltransferase n=1 Tax=Halobacillus salinarum TaxID=2932257 RepID=A0ABY4EQI6_9BACI|nr:GNAT family N-acetyltransferase [Halobacillus salinarum]UOQ45932.1 GNAT family N-acetyltransferase [Halobacillus salinarum]
MNVTYEVIPDANIEECRDLCNQLMNYQKSIAHITPERFDSMNFETRLLPSIQHAKHNFTVVVKDHDELIGYVYSNISPKEAYDNEFATFFDLASVSNDHVGCLSQFYLKEGYRKFGIGSVLFNKSMNWLSQFQNVGDYFVFVSNGNHQALNFYKQKGFTPTHDILDGFITVLRSDRSLFTRL